jgi:hypothetical protein
MSDNDEQFKINSNEQFKFEFKTQSTNGIETLKNPKDLDELSRADYNVITVRVPPMIHMLVSPVSDVLPIKTPPTAYAPPSTIILERFTMATKLVWFIGKLMDMPPGSPAGGPQQTPQLPQDAPQKIKTYLDDMNWIANKGASRVNPFIEWRLGYLAREAGFCTKTTTNTNQYVDSILDYTALHNYLTRPLTALENKKLAGSSTQVKGGHYNLLLQKKEYAEAANYLQEMKTKSPEFNREDLKNRITLKPAYFGKYGPQLITRAYFLPRIIRDNSSLSDNQIIEYATWKTMDDKTGAPCPIRYTSSEMRYYLAQKTDLLHGSFHMPVEYIPEPEDEKAHEEALEEQKMNDDAKAEKLAQTATQNTQAATQAATQIDPTDNDEWRSKVIIHTSKSKNEILGEIEEAKQYKEKKEKKKEEPANPNDLPMSSELYAWAEDILSTDKVASDTELIARLAKEGPMSEEEASWLVSQRGKAQELGFRFRAAVWPGKNQQGDG